MSSFILETKTLNENDDEYQLENLFLEHFIYSLKHKIKEEECLALENELKEVFKRKNALEMLIQDSTINIQHKYFNYYEKSSFIQDNVDKILKKMLTIFLIKETKPLDSYLARDLKISFSIVPF